MDKDSSMPKRKRQKTHHDMACPLSNLPTEMFHEILSYLPHRDIGTLALTSHEFRCKTTSWLESAVGMRQIGVRVFSTIDTENDYTEWITICKRFGILVKRLTMLFATPRRLKHLGIWFQKFRSVCLGEPVVTDEWNTLVHVAGLSTALAHFSSGWDESEFSSVIEILNSQFGLMEKLQFFQTENRSPECESDLKIILRNFYWDHGVMNGSFLSHLFQSYYPMEDKDIARMIYLMVGPTSMGHQLHGSNYQDMTAFQRTMIYKKVYHPQWDACEEDVPTSYNEAKDMMEDIGQMMANLFSTKMPKDRVFRILDCLFGVQDKKQEPSWMLDNIATLLLFSSGSLIKSYLFHCKNTKSPLQVSNLLTSMVVVCDRMDNELAPRYKPGVNSVLEWIFTEYPCNLKNRLYADFWRDVVKRVEDEDLSESMLQQLGSYITSSAYRSLPPRENNFIHLGLYEE